ncbi:MAG: hypothetical protein IPM50_02680 [Acidobacteriota bacterium]|nr:MAG: hypothetical protein IPM50_02680 [Acidobacteriota bacterium]
MEAIAHPGFLLTVAGIVVTLVAWFIRLESKVNDHGKEISRVEQSCEDTWKEFDYHRSRPEIHFDQRLASEVERRQGERMGRIESDVKEIKEIVKGIAKKD